LGSRTRSTLCPPVLKLDFVRSSHAC